MSITVYLPENLLDLKLSMVHVGIIAFVAILIIVVYGINSYQRLSKRRPEEFKP
jgi:hypothetical protein